MLPPPEAVALALVELLQEPFFWNFFRITVTEILVGFGLAVVVGAGLGILLGRSKLFERIASPFIVASQVTPKVALMPLFLLWMGSGMQSKIAMVVLLSFDVPAVLPYLLTGIETASVLAVTGAIVGEYL